MSTDSVLTMEHVSHSYEDGTTVVFYNVMSQVSDDMREVSNRLAEFRLGCIDTNDRSSKI